MQYIFKWNAGPFGGRTRITASNLTEACEKIREHIESKTASKAEIDLEDIIHSEDQ